MKRANVRALAGRVIEKVTIFHGDSENPVSLEIRCVGGIYFCFDVAAQVVASGSALLGYLDKKGNFQEGSRKSFHAKVSLPGSEDLDEI
jgi:hypothetical protein